MKGVDMEKMLPWNNKNGLVTDRNGSVIFESHFDDSVDYADIIVSAVNCHDDLVDALKDAKERFELLQALIGMAEINTVKLDVCVELCKQALSKAEGKNV